MSKRNELEIKRPVRKRMIIPANSSAAAFLLQLQQSDGEGIIFETEADTLASTSKQEWGNFSDTLRKAPHHEPVTCIRKDFEMEIEILEPKLSMLLSGTFNQVGAMGLDDPQNGLQSRFLIYVFEPIPFFKRVSPSLSFNKQSFDELGNEMLSIYQYLRNQKLEVELSKHQWHLFETYFRMKMNRTVKNYNKYISSMIARFALSTFRVIGILATLRSFEEGLPCDTITCNSKDFRNALHLMTIYFQHNLALFSNSKLSQKDPILSKYFDFIELLPSDKEFTRQEAIDLSKHLFSSATIDRRLRKLKKNGFLVSSKPGYYKKIRR